MRLIVIFLFIFPMVVGSLYLLLPGSPQSGVVRIPSSTNTGIRGCDRYLDHIDIFKLIDDPKSSKIFHELFENYNKIKIRKTAVAYPTVVSVNNLHLPKNQPAEIVGSNNLSPGIIDPLLEYARNINLFDDFKPLSDLKLKKMSDDEIIQLKKDSDKFAQEGTDYQRAYLKHYIEGRYLFQTDLVVVENSNPPMWKVETDNIKINKAFDYVEGYWSQLIRRTPTESSGSILSVPYEIIVPNKNRFDEFYYWDSYFGIEGLLKTGRVDLAQKQVENFLYLIQKYGMIPNGSRDYYLTRSQPPFISKMIVKTYKASIRSDGNVRFYKKWLKERAYPLVKNDLLDFWMNPQTRYDAETGLHHHWDELDIARPERHSADKELVSGPNDEKGIGKTYRDSRAGAATGLDFTVAFEQEASKIANVLLNSIIYQYMKDLEWMASELGLVEDVQKFSLMAERKKEAIDKYLWNDVKGQYQNYNLRTKKMVPVLTADTFVPLYVNVASENQAKRVVEKLSVLERKSGIMSSEAVESIHQWDGINGWAPQQMMVMDGLMNYKYNDDAKRIGKKWVDALADIYSERGAFYERIDVSTGDIPVEAGDKYPTQEGFLWTNASFVWTLNKVLGVEFKPIR